MPEYAQEDKEKCEVRGLCVTRYEQDHPQVPSNTETLDQIVRDTQGPEVNNSQGSAQGQSLAFEWTVLPSVLDGEASLCSDQRLMKRSTTGGSSEIRLWRAQPYMGGLHRHPRGSVNISEGRTAGKWERFVKCRCLGGAWSGQP